MPPQLEKKEKKTRELNDILTPDFFNQELSKPRDEKSRVEEMMVEKSEVKKFGVEAWG
jgi:hypothetical protein